MTKYQQVMETNGNHQKTAQGTVKYEVHGAGAPEAILNHQRYEKPKTSRALISFCARAIVYGPCIAERMTRKFVITELRSLCTS